MNEKREHGLGALPPPGMEWIMGKTAASISFVHDAEEYLSNCKDLKEIDWLHDAIAKIKRGEWQLQNWLTAVEFLEMKRNGKI